MISIFLLSLNIAVNVTFRPNTYSKARGPEYNCLNDQANNCLIHFNKRCVLTNERERNIWCNLKDTFILGNFKYVFDVQILI